MKSHANVNTDLYAGVSALQGAVVANNLTVIKLLLKQNCYMENKRFSMIQEVSEPQHPFMVALTRGNEKIVKLLCEAGYPLPEFSTIVKHLSAVMQHDNDLVQWLYDFSHNPRISFTYAECTSENVMEQDFFGY